MVNFRRLNQPLEGVRQDKERNEDLQKLDYTYKKEATRLGHFPNEQEMRV
jgi:hypothetical protein